MYLDDVATAIRARVSDDLVPEERPEPLFRMYAVLALAKGTAVSGADVHNAWVAWMAEIDLTHESLVSYDLLDASTQQEDSPFVAAIRTVAEELGRGAD